MKALAYAKINLTLDVLGLREDGYHDLEMIMQSVSLHDTLRYKMGEAFRLTCSIPWVPCDERNIVMKAVRRFAAETGITPQGEISLEKRIPVCAGLGGGSSDGAAALRLLDRVYHTRIPEDTLAVWALSLGSDVPFCLNGGIRHAQGRGDQLAALPTLPDCSIVLCKPNAGVSTRDAFKRLDRQKRRLHPDTAGAIRALTAGDLTALAGCMYNVFEEMTAEACRDIVDIRSALLAGGALGAVMSGSGTTMLGLFANEKKASDTVHALKAQYRNTFLTTPVAHGVELIDH